MSCPKSSCKLIAFIFINIKIKTNTADRFPFPLTLKVWLKIRNCFVIISVQFISSQVAQVVKKDKPAFLTEEEEEEEKKKQLLKLGTDPNSGPVDFTQLKYPPELKCPFGDHIIKDAVLVPCCGHFICCDECIREKISNDECVECPYEECDQEIGSLESITPYHNMRRMVNDYLNDIKLANQRTASSSTSNGGSVVANTFIPSKPGGVACSGDPFLDSLLDDLTDAKYQAKIQSPKLDYDELIIKADKEEKLDFVDSKPIEELNDLNHVPTGAESPLQDSKISSSEVNAQASLKLQQGITVGNFGPALLPTPPMSISDNLVKMPPIISTSITPPPLVNTALPPRAPFMNEPRLPFNNNMPQFRMNQPGFVNMNPPGFNTKIRPNIMPPHRMPVSAYPAQQHMPINMPPQQQQQQQHVYNQGYMNQMNPMLNRQMPYQQDYQAPHLNQPVYPINQGPQFAVAGLNAIPANGYMGNPGMGGPPRMNMPPFVGATNPQLANMYQMGGGVPLNPINTKPQKPMLPLHHHHGMQPALPIMTEAEFYSYKKKLRKEAELQQQQQDYRGGGGVKHRRRRRSSSGSRSYTPSSSRSYSSSRSRSRTPRTHRRRTSRSYSSKSRSYSRSRSRASSPRTNRTRQKHAKKYSKSRSRSPARNYNSTKQFYAPVNSYEAGKHLPVDKYYRSGKDGQRRHRRDSRSPSRSKTGKNFNYGRNKSPGAQQQPPYPDKYSRSRTRSKSPMRGHKYSRSRSGSPNRFAPKSNRRNEAHPVPKQAETRTASRQVSGESMKQKEIVEAPLPQQSKSYDQVVHKIMNKIRRPSNSEQTEEKDSKSDKKSVKSSRSKRDKDSDLADGDKEKSKKSSKHDKEPMKLSEKRPSSSLMPSVEYNNVDQARAVRDMNDNPKVSPVIHSSSDVEVMKKKAKKGGDSGDEIAKEAKEGSGGEDAKEKKSSSKHKKSKKHKHKHKHRSTSRRPSVSPH